MFKKIIFGFSILVLAFACSSGDDSTTSSNGDGFDRSTLLVNWADNIIIPAFQDFDAKLRVLKDNKDTFITMPNQTNLDVLRASWLNAYKVWQHVAIFHIGKAEELLFINEMNIFPTNTLDIENNISNGNYDLTNDNNDDAVGFPALDYLLYGVALNDTTIIEKYTDAKYTNYLSDIIDRMVMINELILTDWTSNYRNTFISETGNTKTSSVNKISNDFIFQYEKLFRVKKIGTPSGVFSGGNVFSDKVEGVYSKIYSKALALEALSATQNFFEGKKYSSSVKGASFDTYLAYLDRQDIVNIITERLNNVRVKLQALNDNFATQVDTDNTKMTKTYDVIQLCVISFKVDMMQAFNISFDFKDNDGD